MAKTGEIGNREPQENIDFPRDLIHRFMFNNLSQKTSEEEEELELSLGLSLNGRFGVDPRAKKLTRSSSIPEFLTNHLRKESNDNESETSCGFPMASVPLVRTSSLPTETEEEWRKRKELQTLRRMEAKRKRSEKQKSLKAARCRIRGPGEENCEEDKRDEVVNENSGRVACGVEVKGEKGVVDYHQPVAASQVSNGSLGSGSSRMSELEGQSIQGTNKSSEARSPSSVQSTIEAESRSRIPPPSRLLSQLSGNFVGVARETNPGNPTLGNNGVEETVKNKLEDMPCVSTTGDGPNGKRIEGFLYRYRKGEEVRIVCVCHGSFLSPAEFVKHAGGGDVAHPLKHIVVNPSPLL